MSIGKVDEVGGKYVFKEFLSFPEYIPIVMTTATDLPHFRMVDKDENAEVKSKRMGKNYKSGTLRLYQDSMPVRFSIENINAVGKIFKPPRNKEEAEGSQKRQILRKYQIYGLVLCPVDER